MSENDADALPMRFAAFDWVMHQLVPYLDPLAMVYEVDASGPANVVLRAAVFENDDMENGKMLSEPVTKIVSQAYLSELARLGAPLPKV